MIKKINKYYVLIRLALQGLVLRLIANVLFRRTKNDTPKTIILFRTCLLGDFLFAVPAISILRQRFPDARIIFMTTFAGNKKTVRGSKKYLSNDSDIPPWFSFIYPEIVNDIFFIKDFALENIYPLRKKLNSLEPDLMFILPHPSDAPLGLAKKLFFLKILGVSKNVYGFNVKGDYSFGRNIQNDLGLFTHKVLGPIRALKEYYSLANINENNVLFPLTIRDDANTWAEEKLNQVEHPQLVIALAIGSIQLHKRWVIENYSNLIKKIEQYHYATFLLVGTKNDLDLGEYIKKQHPKSSIINLIAQTTVEQLAAVFKRTDILIGNDGGAIHLAAAVNCKTISIISGIEYPYSIEPWGFINYAVRHSVSCSPCYSMTECPLKHNKCLTELPVDKVYEMFTKVVKTIDKVSIIS